MTTEGGCDGDFKGVGTSCEDIPDPCLEDTSPCPGEGDCCVDDGLPGCDDEDCCALVCACDPFCCETGWDDFCAGTGFGGSGCGAALLCDACMVPSCGEADAPACNGSCDAGETCVEDVTAGVNGCVCVPGNNDLCEDAITVAVPSLTSGSTVDATDVGAPGCGNATPQTAGGVWYEVVGTGNTITASTCSDSSNGTANYDTQISVYCPSCSDLSCVTGNDDFPETLDCNRHSQVSWCSEAGKAYLILVHGFSDARGDFELHVFDDETPCEVPAPCFIDCCSMGGDCSDPDCRTQVCACDDFCCNNWDSNCAGPNSFVPGCSALDLCALCMPCGDSEFPTCGGACPAGFTCEPGDFTTAGGGECFCVPTGACCVEGTSCVETTESTCTIIGLYQGDGTSCDDEPNPCQPECGDSEFPTCGGTCEPGFTCEPFEFATAGTDGECRCVPTGACCVEGTSCVETTESTCTIIGLYQGDGTSCDDEPNPCQPECGESEFPTCGGTCEPGFTCEPFEFPAAGVDGECRCVPLGACCFPNGECLDGMTLETCDRPALFQGVGTTCETVTCRPPRGGSSQKGSLLYFSKIEIKWDAAGNLIQDTFVDITNDFPQGVNVQAYFINGDIEIEELLDESGGVIRGFEPGWNTADCRFTLTANQPHFWSAANGSDKCQPFTVLDDDGPGRLDPEANDDSRILRGFAIFFAVDFFTIELENPGILSGWFPIKWNHLKGDAVLVNYANKTAWEYNAWAFRVYGPPQGCTLLDPPLPGCDPIEPVGADFPPAALLVDFYASGSTALSGGNQSVMVNTDLTLHAVSLDLRQDGCGPVLTKVEAEIWNENENKFSGTRRCICCWDQTMLSDWSRREDIPNHFVRETLGTDKGKARLSGVASIECDYLELCGPTAYDKMWRCGFDTDVPQTAGIPSFSQDAAILGLATKFLSFSPSGKQDTAGLNLVGVGEGTAFIIFDLQLGPEEFQAHRGTVARSDHSTDGKGAGVQSGPAMMIELGRRLPESEAPPSIKQKESRQRGSLRR